MRKLEVAMGIKPRILWSLFLMTFLLTIFILEGLTVPLRFLDKLPQLVTIFLSIIIQALPFILFGVFGSALMQYFVTETMIQNRLASTGKLSGILLAISAGFFFPVCDCGVIPVARRLLLKKVPPYLGIAFLITAPLVNPITIWATATAFGANPRVTLIRVAMAISVGVIVALLVSEFLPELGDILNQRAIRELETAAASTDEMTAGNHREVHKESRFFAVFNHANQEFLEVGRFLISGALLAAFIQTVVPKESLLAVTENPALSVLVMMGLALVLSLCAEADAFVARSFVYHFPLGSVMAFMVFGQIIDLKNIALLLKSFKLRAILFIFGVAAILVFGFCWFLNLSGFENLIWGRF